MGTNSVIEQLKKEVETVFGRNLLRNSDFTSLSEEICAKTDFLMSPTTLKRLWGYIEANSSGELRTSSLNIISRYCGYINYQDFLHRSCEDKSQVLSSAPNYRQVINATDLEDGQTITLMWTPGRRVTVKHEHDNVFTILESINSKLEAGDTFLCNSFVEGLPLILTELTGKNHTPMNYCCAKSGEGLVVALS